MNVRSDFLEFIDNTPLIKLRGGVIVDGTAGNVGISIALVGNARGHRSVIVMSDTQRQEKDMLRLCGADLRLIPAVPY